MRKWIAIALLLVGVGQLCVRALRRSDNIPLWDFTPIYIATHDWIRGGDPYDIQTIRSEWSEMTGSQANVDAWWSVYPPSTFVVVAPFGALPPRVALYAWATISILLFLCAIAALADLAEFNWRDERAWLLLGGVICSAPAQFGLLSGQPSVVVLSLSIIAVWCVANHRDRTAGALLAIATAIKPQVAAPFVIYYLVLRDWRVTDTAFLLLCVIAATAITAMHLTHVDWIGGWSSNLRGTVARGGVNDIASDNPWRDQIVSLAVMFRAIVHDPLLPRILAMCVTALMLALFVIALPRRAARNDLLPLATLAAVSLLPVYHRICDALILCIAFAWALAELDGPRRRFAIAALVPLAVFLVPFNFLNSILYRAPGLASQIERWWWQVFLVPHYAWAALLACVLLLRAMWIDQRMNLLRSSSAITSASRSLT